MPRNQKASQRAARRAHAKALVLAAGGAVLLAAWPAEAQQVALRGEVAEADVNRELLGRPTLADRPSVFAAPPAPEETEDATPGYVPYSPGAVAEEEADTPEEAGTLFPSAEPEDDTFQPITPEPRPAGAPGSDEAEETAEAEQDAESARPSAEEAAELDEETTGGTERQPRVDADDEERNSRVETDNARAEPIEGLDKREEENPYAPLGLRIGTFNVTPTLEQGVTWTSNANYSPTPKPAFLSETTLRLNAISDWSRHSAVINAFGTYRKTISGEEITEPSAGVDATFNLDIREDLRGVARLGYELRPESADSPVQLPVTVSRPLRHTLTGSVGVEKDVGKLRFALTGDVERLTYDDAKLGGGGVLSQRERNSTLFTGTLRAGYEISPALTPFAEVEYGRREYELTLDSNGFARSSNRTAARAGVELDLGEKLTGEVSAGWISERFDDSRLEPVSGLAAAADLTWSPERGTTVNLNAETIVEGTTTAGESGSLLYTGRLSAARELRSNLTLDAALGASWRDYAGTTDRDLTLTAETSLTWWLNRYAGITGRYRFEQLNSTLPNRDTTTNSVYLGVKLQR